MSASNRIFVEAARHNRLTRRGFLRAAGAATAGAVAAPYFVPQSAFGANERIVTGHIATGRQGMNILGQFMGRGVRVAALCDVDSNHLARGMEAAEQRQHKPEAYGDYRELLGRRDVDAVVICTPDHWHAKMSIDACRAGKDVYVEKPLTLTVMEGRKMVQAARRHERIVQNGSQQRSVGDFRRACELVRSGKLGGIKQVLVGLPASNHPGAPIPDSDPPPELDYEMWLGPAPSRPYNRNRVHYNFRFFWDYSGGQMTNFGAHDIDIAQWGLGMDDSGPVEVWGEAGFHPRDYHEVTETCRISFKYSNGVELLVGQGQPDVPGGATFIGSEGRIHVSRRGLIGDPEELTRIELGEDDVRLYRSSHHVGNFLDCVKSREPPICDVEIGHRSATVCHLGNMAARLGRKITWDPRQERIVGDDEAQAMAVGTHREPWTL